MLPRSSAFIEFLATTAFGESTIACATRNRVGAPMRAIRCNVSLGRDRNITMRIVIKMDRGVFGCELECVALETRLGDCGVFRAEAINVSTSVLSTQAPSNLCNSASLPICWLLCREYLGSLLTPLISLGNGSVWCRVCGATGDAAWIRHRCLAWSTPRVVLRKVTALGVAMRIPSTKLWIVVSRLHQPLCLRAVRSRI